MIVNDNEHLINMAPYRNLFIILGEIILLTVGRDFFVTIYCIWMLLISVSWDPLSKIVTEQPCFSEFDKREREREQGECKCSQQVC